MQLNFERNWYKTWAFGMSFFVGLYIFYYILKRHGRVQNRSQKLLVAMCISYVVHTAFSTSFRVYFTSLPDDTNPAVHTLFHRLKLVSTLIVLFALFFLSAAIIERLRVLDRVTRGAPLRKTRKCLHVVNVLARFIGIVAGIGSIAQPMHPSHPIHTMLDYSLLLNILFSWLVDFIINFVIALRVYQLKQTIFSERAAAKQYVKSVCEKGPGRPFSLSIASYIADTDVNEMAETVPDMADTVINGKDATVPDRADTAVNEMAVTVPAMHIVDTKAWPKHQEPRRPSTNSNGSSKSTYYRNLGKKLFLIMIGSVISDVVGFTIYVTEEKIANMPAVLSLVWPVLGSLHFLFEVVYEKKIAQLASR